MPQGPARLGPRRSCIQAATLRSANVSYIATKSETLMMIRISTHFSINKTQSKCIIGLFRSLIFIGYALLVRVPWIPCLDTRRPPRLMRLKIRRMCRPLNFGKIDLRSVHLANAMDIHQQLRLPPIQHIIQHLLRPFDTYIMALRDHGVPAHLRRPLDRPVSRILLLEPAFITDPRGHLAPLVLAGSHPEHLCPAIPKIDLPATLGILTIPMRIHRLQKPNAILEPKGLIRQRPHRAHIDDIADKIIVQRLLDKGRDLGMIAAIEYPMHALLRQLIRR